jgi:flagellar hook-associated protein 2
VADAINKAGMGVTATIVSDGSATPYHLVLTSNKTGENASMKISLSGDGSNPPDAALSSLLSYDPAGSQSMQQTSAAQDTKLTVNGIAVSSHSNTVSEAIQGVSLTVNQVGSTSLNVARDTNSVKTSLQGFVKAYNELNGALKKLTAYDPETKKAGALQGDPTAQSMQAQLRRMLSGQIGGLSGSLTNLGQVGISFAKDGTLSLDDAKLSKAIEKNFADIAGLFTAIGNSTDGNVNFVSSTSKTKPGSYALNITTLASQGALTSSAAVAGTDVAGTLGGKAVIGNGQTLTGADGTDAEGLKIEITGGAVGERGTVSFSQGYAYQLNNLATSFLGSGGLLTTVTDGLNKTIKDVAKQRDAFSTKLDDIEKRYRAQFTRLDVTLAKMQSTQAYLTQQLAALASNS